jgi:hypothetical protein
MTAATKDAPTVDEASAEQVVDEATLFPMPDEWKNYRWLQVKRLKQLREPFPPSTIGKLPKPTSKDARPGNCPECKGYHRMPAVHLDYVGHAAITTRLLEVDPFWTWEPQARDEKGLPYVQGGALWINLTVCGVTKPGMGDAGGKAASTTALKEMIGDALRNAGMRFGMALDLWAKEDLAALREQQGTQVVDARAEQDAAAEGPTAEYDEPEPPAPAYVESDEEANSWDLLIEARDDNPSARKTIENLRTLSHSNGRGLPDVNSIASGQTGKHIDELDADQLARLYRFLKRGE